MAKFSTLQAVLKKAQKGGYAVGAFNVNNMEFVQAIIAAGNATKSPVIISTTEGAIKYAGLDYLYSIISVALSKAKVPVVLHLDHGRDMKVIKACLKAGYKSVMYDGSHLPFKENVKQTRRVVKMAKKYGASVEGELGTIGGAEDLVSSRKIVLTEPEDAKKFVKQTGVDALAVAIGTSHGAYKFTSSSKLDIKRLDAIEAAVRVPLVLHGASGVPSLLVKLANKFGAKIKNAHGVSDKDIRAVVKRGICKVNEDTDLRLAFTGALRQALHKKPAVFDPRKLLGPGRDAVQKIVENRIKVLGSRGKA